MTTSCKTIFTILSCIGLIFLIQCATTSNPDGSETHTVLGMPYAETPAPTDENPDPDPVTTSEVDMGVKVVGGFFSPGVALGLKWLVGMAPWLARSRSRKKLWSGVKNIAKGEIAEAAGDWLASVGLEHSERDPLKVAMALRTKLIAEGKLDPESGLPFEYVAGKARPLPEMPGPMPVTVASAAPSAMTGSPGRA